MAGVEALHQIGVDPPVRLVLDHADLLGDDALLLVHALLGEVGLGDKGEEDAEALIELLGTLEVVAGDGVGGEGVVHGPVFRQLLEGVPLPGVEHLVLQVVGDAGGGVPPDAVQAEAQVHAAVAGGEEGVPLGVVGLVDHHDLQAVMEAEPGHPLPQLGILLNAHSSASFPLRK